MQRVTQGQLALCLFLYNFATSTGFMLAPLTAAASYQGWVVIVLAAVSGTLIAYISTSLGKQRSGEYIVHYGKELVGRWLHVIFMAIFFFYFIHVAGSVLREITDFIIQIYLPTTPAWVVAGLFGLVVSVGVRAGVEAIFRCATGFFFVIMSTIVFMPLLVGPELKYNRAIAFITHLNPGELFQPVYQFTPWFGTMFMVLFYFPMLAKPEKTFRSLIWATLGSVLFMELNFVLCLLMLGSNLTGNMTYPVLELLRFIRVGDFLENLDPFVVAVWLSSVFINISMSLYVPVVILSQSLRLKDSRPVCLPLGAVMVGISMHVADNITELHYFLGHAWPTFALLVQCTPAIYLIMSAIKKRRSKRQNSSAEHRSILTGQK